MHKAIRTQADEDFQLFSRGTAISFLGTRNTARQEFRDEADLNKLLARYGVGLPVRPPQFGLEVDYSIDLQQALGAVSEAKHAWRNLPPNLRAKYPSWTALLNALESGALVLRSKEPEPPVPKPTPTPAAG